MAQPISAKLTLRAPVRFTWDKPDNGQGEGWNFTTADNKEKYVTFLPKLVDAFEKSGLAEKEADYLVKVSDNGKAPQLVGIPGVWEKGSKGGGSGYGGGKPMFTDRQVALLAASGDVSRAQVAYEWLTAGAPPTAPQTPQEPRAGSASPADAPAEIAPQRQRELAEICRALVWAVVGQEVGPNAAAATIAGSARNFLIERFGDGFTTLEAVHYDELVKLRDELEKAAPRGQSPSTASAG